MPGEEQQQIATEPVETAPATDAPSEGDAPSGGRSDLIAQIEADLAGESTETPTQEPSAEGDAAEPELTGTAKLAAMVRARTKANALREQAIAEREAAASARAQAEAEIAQIRAEAERERAAAKAELERLKKLKGKPLEAIKEIGWDHTDLVAEVAAEGKPEYQLLQKERAAREKLEAEMAEIRSFFAEQKQAKELERQAAEQQAKQQAARKVYDTFLESHANAERCPTLHKLYSPQEICMKGDLVADHYKQMQLEAAERGERLPPCTYDDIAEHLEEQAKAALGKAAPQQAVGATGNAPKAKASGTRTLSGKGASERRAAPRPLAAMSPAEERRALIEAAEAAIASPE